MRTLKNIVKKVNRKIETKKENLKQKNKINNKGITLSSLVVTSVLMLLIAGIGTSAYISLYKTSRTQLMNENLNLIKDKIEGDKENIEQKLIIRDDLKKEYSTSKLNYTDFKNYVETFNAYTLPTAPRVDMYIIENTDIKNDLKNIFGIDEKFTFFYIPSHKIYGIKDLKTSASQIIYDISTDESIYPANSKFHIFSYETGRGIRIVEDASNKINFRYKIEYTRTGENGAVTNLEAFFDEEFKFLDFEKYDFLIRRMESDGKETPVTIEYATGETPLATSTVYSPDGVAYIKYTIDKIIPPDYSVLGKMFKPIYFKQGGTKTMEFIDINTQSIHDYYTYARDEGLKTLYPMTEAKNNANNFIQRNQLSAYVYLDPVYYHFDLDIASGLGDNIFVWVMTEINGKLEGTWVPVASGTAYKNATFNLSISPYDEEAAQNIKMMQDISKVIPAFWDLVLDGILTWNYNIDGNRFFRLVGGSSNIY